MSLAPMHRYVGRVVHLIRQEKGMKQSELALLTGLKQPNLSRIENGLVTPRPATLDKISKALGVEVQEFFSENRVQEVERKWAASLGPKHAALIMAGKLAAVPLLDTSAGYPERMGANREPQGRMDLVMQLPPFGAEQNGARLFGFRVNGDSMLAADGEGFRPGEIVVFSTIPDVKAGDYAFVILQEGSLFRKVESLDADSVKLVPLNRTYQDRVIMCPDIVRMWKLVRYLRSY